MPKDPNEIGALWIKNAGTQKEFMSGTVNGQDVVVFPNKYKKPGDRTPDFRILRSTRPAPKAGADEDVPF